MINMKKETTEEFKFKAPCLRRITIHD